MKNLVKELFELEQECFEENAWSLKQIEAHLQNGKIFTLRKDELIGYLFYYENEDFSELLRIGVKKNYRRQKMASQLLEHLMVQNKTILLEVHEENLPAISLYKKYLFEIYSVRKNYYTDGKNALCMIRKANP